MMQTRQRLIHAARHSSQAFMRSASNPASGTHGRSLSPVRSEAEHFYICPSCSQAVDMRDLGQVLHHETEPHDALPVS